MIKRNKSLENKRAILRRNRSEKKKTKKQQLLISIFEPRYDKTSKMTVRPAKAQITQSDQSLLCAQLVAKDPSFLYADSGDSDQTGRMPRLQSESPLGAQPFC